MSGCLLADNDTRSDRSILFAVDSVIIANRKSRLGTGVGIGGDLTVAIRNTRITVIRDTVIVGERWGWMEISDARWKV